MYNRETKLVAKKGKYMRLHIQYVGRHNEILIREEAEYPEGHATEQALQKFAMDHLNGLDLSQRCASAIVEAHVFTIATKARWPQ